jgi:hypothetical protein
VDLVDSLDAAAKDAKEVTAPGPAAEEALRIPMAEVCGYFDLGEVRQVRDSLHEQGIPAEIVIRASPETQPGGAVVEEYWLHADAQQIRQAVAFIDQQPDPKEAAGSFKCSNCDRPVREEESFCANCGMRFSE